MAEPITFSLAAIAAAEFIGHSIGSHVISREARDKYRHFLETLQHRLIMGGVPANEHLLHALPKQGQRSR